jgi:predicted ATP-dependent protease
MRDQAGAVQPVGGVNEKSHGFVRIGCHGQRFRAAPAMKMPD